MFRIIYNNLLAILLIFTACSFFENVNATDAIPSVKTRSISRTKIKERFEKSLNTFLSDRGFPGAMISVFKDGELIINEGFGSCSNAEKIVPLASLSKLFTEAAIRKLISENRLSDDTKVYHYLKYDYPLIDKRIENITIRQLLEHRTGWNTDVGKDPLFSLDADFAGTDPREVTKSDFLKFVFAHYPLDHKPGLVNSYCNLGYFLLGEVIEKAAGQSYLNHINEEFAHPIDIQLHQGISPTEYAREIPFKYCFSLELATTSFGLASTLHDVGYFFSKYNRSGQLKKSPSKEKECWWHDGSLPGMVTLLMRQRYNDVLITVYIPDRDESNWMADNEALKNLIDNAANSVGL